MDRKMDASAMIKPGLRITESKSDFLRQAVQNLDEMMEEFSEIQVGLIRDESDNL